MFCQKITLQLNLYYEIKVNKHVFLSIHKTFQPKKEKKYANFSSLGSGYGTVSGQKLPDPDPTKKVRIRNTALQNLTGVNERNVIFFS
jgi:hypothetical protein